MDRSSPTMAKYEKRLRKWIQYEVQERDRVELDDMVFGHLEDDEISPFSSFKRDERDRSLLALDQFVEKEEEADDGTSEEENNNFWKSQHELLQGTLCRSSSLETRIRQVTKEALKEIEMAAAVCNCGRPMANSCRGCLMREVSSRLQSAGFESSICRSKWRRSSDIPSGEHRFIDVVDKSSSRRSSEVRVIIELNFRAEFEIARASQEYNKLVRRLPQVFIGKAERLSNVIKIVCTAAKKCLKEKKMHLAPWRKHKYMQAKWLGTCERAAHVSAQTLLLPIATDNNNNNNNNNNTSVVVDGRLPKPRASMLTVGFLDKLPNMHRTAVEVL